MERVGSNPPPIKAFKVPDAIVGDFIIGISDWKHYWKDADLRERAVRNLRRSCNRVKGKSFKEGNAHKNIRFALGKDVFK
jgi:hypothetical protein